MSQFVGAGVELIGTLVFGKDFTYQSESKTLTLGFCGKEWGKKLLSGICRDTAAVI